MRYSSIGYTRYSRIGYMTYSRIRDICYFNIVSIHVFSLKFLLNAYLFNLYFMLTEDLLKTLPLLSWRSALKSAEYPGGKEWYLLLGEAWARGRGRVRTETQLDTPPDALIQID